LKETLLKIGNPDPRLAFIPTQVRKRLCRCGALGLQGYQHGGDWPKFRICGSLFGLKAQKFLTPCLLVCFGVAVFGKISPLHVNL
jgi:hypothetical protein